MALLSQVAQAVRPLVEKLNGRPMRKLGKSRRELFEQVSPRVTSPARASTARSRTSGSAAAGRLTGSSA